MTTAEDRALADSVDKLNDTASSLTALIKIVDKNQKLLVENQEATLDNMDAISLRSTKEELLKEVNRLALERKRDQKKTKRNIFGTFFISLILIVVTIFTTQEFQAARHDANSAYAQANQEICVQRSITWDAMQKWITTQRDFLEQDVVSDPALKVKRIAAYDELLKSFPDVDCTIASKLVGLTTPSGLDYKSNLILATIK